MGILAVGPLRRGARWGAADGTQLSWNTALVLVLFASLAVKT
jgi:hypothetical protein